MAPMNQSASPSTDIYTNGGSSTPSGGMMRRKLGGGSPASARGPVEPVPWGNAGSENFGPTPAPPIPGLSSPLSGSQGASAAPPAAPVGNGQGPVQRQGPRSGGGASAGGTAGGNGKASSASAGPAAPEGGSSQRSSDGPVATPEQKCVLTLHASSSCYFHIRLTSLHLLFVAFTLTGLTRCLLPFPPFPSILFPPVLTELQSW